MVEVHDIRMPGGHVAQAHLARPSGRGTGGESEQAGPGVLFCMDAFGLRPRIAAMAQRIADWGYVVLAPNVFWRSGSIDEVAPRSDLHSDEGREAAFGAAAPRIEALTTELLEGDLPAYLSALRGLPEVTVVRVGVTGYCMGARIAVRAATVDPDVVAVGGFHGGRLATSASDSPHRGLPQARAEFLFRHADHDSSMGPDAIEELGRALDAAELTASNEVYPGAAHGYSMADTSTYDETAAERHFTELRELLARTLRPA